jgi:DNA adenine methylase
MPLTASGTHKQRTEPLLKWPGGKRWLAAPLKVVCDAELSGTYIEPFLGGAAMFVELQPRAAILSDINRALIETLRTIRDAGEIVLTAVWRLSNTRDCYVRVRASNPRDPVGAAARFVYLNRTCWGGVYRLNRRGQFNVPFGGSGRVICRRKHFLEFSKLFQNARLECSDFESQMAGARHGDLIYADPPYTTLGENNGFLRYNEGLFSWSDQQRLACAARSAANRGAFVAVSGLWHAGLFTLYRGWWVCKVSRSVCVSRRIASRRRVSEAIFFSRHPKQLPEKFSEIAKIVI